MCHGSVFCERLATKRIQIAPTEFRFVCDECISIYGLPHMIQELLLDTTSESTTIVMPGNPGPGRYQGMIK